MPLIHPKYKNGLKLLLLLHGFATLAASLTLIIAPTAIPQTIHIVIQPNQYILCYFLGAAELSIAFLSFAARSIKDKQALQIILVSFILFHISTGILEVLALSQGTSTAIIPNIIIRIVIALLFWHYGFHTNKNYQP